MDIYNNEHLLHVFESLKKKEVTFLYKTVDTIETYPWSPAFLPSIRIPRKLNAQNVFKCIEAYVTHNLPGYVVILENRFSKSFKLRIHLDVIALDRLHQNLQLDDDVTVVDMVDMVDMVDVQL